MNRKEILSVLVTVLWCVGWFIGTWQYKYAWQGFTFFTAYFVISFTGFVIYDSAQKENNVQ